MKKRYMNQLFLFAGIILLASCKPELDVPSPDKGSLDVSKYVSIGNSITSGFADAALYYNGQVVAYPNLVAEQFKTIGGGNFNQAYVPVGSVGLGSSLNARYMLGYKTDCKGVSSLSPGPIAPSGDPSIFLTSVAAQGPFNNIGIPGAKAITTVYPGYGNPANGLGKYNPFFTRMLNSSEYATASMLSKAAEQNATFFSLFIGNNDVLGFASSGGTSDAITPSAGSPGVGFDASIDAIIGTMTSNGAKGVIGNVPDVTSLPYFTTIPYNGLTLDATQAAQLTAAYTALGITFTAGSNAFIIQDNTAPGGMRKIKSNELVLLNTPQDSLKCAGWGSQKPLANMYVLTEAEINLIQAAVSAYNAKLRAVANAKGLAYVDVNQFMATVKKGIAYNGITLNTTFVSGGAFSLDGVHLTPRGNAMLANEFIKSINSTYGSTIPQVDVTKYGGVLFP
ncbi:MAG TPA: SGNH/GDSL hydrolase family protein [Bacteroidia bacterium]|nr:SGNH/GDSL hydrolase family protein [Bacteroidia bacterium]